MHNFRIEKEKEILDEIEDTRSSLVELKKILLENITETSLTDAQLKKHYDSLVVEYLSLWNDYSDLISFLVI